MEIICKCLFLKQRHLYFLLLIFCCVQTISTYSGDTPIDTSEVIKPSATVPTLPTGTPYTQHGDSGRPIRITPPVIPEGSAVLQFGTNTIRPSATQTINTSPPTLTVTPLLNALDGSQSTTAKTTSPGTNSATKATTGNATTKATTGNSTTQATTRNVTTQANTSNATTTATTGNSTTQAKTGNSTTQVITTKKHVTTQATPQKTTETPATTTQDTTTTTRTTTSSTTSMQTTTESRQETTSRSDNKTWCDEKECILWDVPNTKFTTAEIQKLCDHVLGRECTTVIPINPTFKDIKAFNQLDCAHVDTPPGKFVRKEFRLLTTKQRRKFKTAVWKMKRSTLYDTFHILHHYQESPGAHLGAAFLVWHREFICRSVYIITVHDNILTVNARK